jgi:hypothetical protein
LSRQLAKREEGREEKERKLQVNQINSPLNFSFLFTSYAFVSHSGKDEVFRVS